MEREKEKERDYIIQRAIKAEVGEMVGGLCISGGERAQKAGKKAWFAMEETRERDSKEKANVVNSVCIYNWVKEKKN